MKNSIFMDNTLTNDPSEISFEKKANRGMADYSLTSFYKPCQKSINSTNKKDEIANNFGLYTGVGINTCLIDVDTKMSRSDFVNKPADKLSSKLDEGRRFDYLRNYRTGSNVDENGICANSFGKNNCDILTATTIARDPQRNFNPTFDRFGINTRNYKRRPSSLFKKQKN